MNSIRRPLSTWTLLVVLIASAAVGQQDALAQGTLPPNWERIDLGLNSGLVTDGEIPQSLYFRDALNGYLATDTDRVAGGTEYTTTDGGRTWTTPPAWRPVGFTMIDDSFGVAINGVVTYDAGLTSRKLTMGSADSILRQGLPYIMTASNQRHLVTSVSSGYPYYDSASGFVRNMAVTRLARSTDGGETWVPLDSVRVIYHNGSPMADIRTTPFGPLPAPAEITNPLTGWVSPVAMPDSSHAVVVSFARSRNSADTAVYFYLGRVDLATQRVEWSELTMWRNRDPSGLDATRSIHYLNPAFVWTALGQPVGLWQSLDSGRTWNTLPVPSWLATWDLKFFSTTSAVAQNGRSTDGGLTWERFDNPFRWPNASTYLFSAADSLHLVAAEPGSLIARSSDAGRTWVRNQAGPSPLATIAHDGHVLIARPYRSLLVSRDAGVTWRDVLEQGTFPPDLREVLSLVFDDTGTGTSSVTALARFVPSPGEEFWGITKSTDGGDSWSAGIRVTALDGIPFSVLSMSAVRAGGVQTIFIRSRRGLLASTDGGTTWTNRYPHELLQLVMVDNERGAALEGYQGKLIATSDGGRSWTRAAVPVDSAGFVNAIGGIGPDALRAFVRTGPGALVVLGSTDGGQGWSILDTSRGILVANVYGMPTLWIDTMRIYIFDDEWFSPDVLYYSRNGGRSFARLVAPFEEMLAASDDRFGYVSGLGNRAARWSVASEPAAVPVAVSTNGSLRLLASRSNQSTQTLEYVLQHRGLVEISIVDMLGNVVDRNMVGEQEPGSHRESLDLQALPTGRYLVRLHNGSTIESLAFVVVR